MSKRVVVLGAGFGGLELSSMLSEAFGGDIDVMFGRTTPQAIRLPYRDT